MVQQVERIGTELQILFMPCVEILEEGHVYTVVAGTVDLIGAATEILDCRCSVRDRRGDLIARQRIRKCARVIPVGLISRR